jgi:hypothetical protein
MTSPIKDSIAKLKNNPVMAIGGGIATYYLIKKKMPTSQIATNPVYLLGSVFVGVLFTAYATSYIKRMTSNPTLY